MRCDASRSPAVAAKLETEKASQSAHVKKVKNKLREIKAGLFANKDKHKRGAETIDVRTEGREELGWGAQPACLCSPSLA